MFYFVFRSGGNGEDDEVEIGDAFVSSIVINDSGMKAYGRIP